MLERHEVRSVDDTQRGALLERVFVEGEREQDAAQHPDVCLRVHTELQVGVAHLGRPVGDRGLLVELLHLVRVVLLGDESL